MVWRPPERKKSGRSNQYQSALMCRSLEGLALRLEFVCDSVDIWFLDSRVGGGRKGKGG